MYFLLNVCNPSTKLARWTIVIQELDLDIHHRSGKTNQDQVADALSLNPIPVNEILPGEEESFEEHDNIFQIQTDVPDSRVL